MIDVAALYLINADNEMLVSQLMHISGSSITSAGNLHFCKAVLTFILNILASLFDSVDAIAVSH